MNHAYTDCRDETGITVGLVDTLITVYRILKHRDLSSAEVLETLKDLRQDEDVFMIFGVSSK